MTRLFLLVFLASSAAASDTLEYPRQIVLDGHRLKIHHPVIDRWDEFSHVEGWLPIEVRLAGADRSWVGAVRARAATTIDLPNRLVTLSSQEILQVRFTDEAAPPAAFDMARRAVRDREQTVLLDVVLRALALDFEAPAQAGDSVGLNHSPPRIMVASAPTRLLMIDQQPVRAPISGTGLDIVVNTDWPLFFARESNSWWVLNDGVWQTSSLLASGAWITRAEVPRDFETLVMSDRWPALREAWPPRLPDGAPPRLLISMEPTELIVINGEPELTAINEGGLVYVANTDRDLFQLDGRWYFLAAGRWFESQDLSGSWQPVKALPPEFATIPPDHPRARSRSAVPGTEEAIVAMMEAVLPRTRTVGPDAAASLAVGYVGEPRFEPVEGTRLTRAVNSPFWIFRHNNYYYLCIDAAWYFSAQPAGPWSVSRTVPEEIFRIPANDPAHVVTYVRPSPAAPGSADGATFTYNAGYLGEYSTGVTVVQGTGWYYPPWIYRHPAGYPVYWGYPHSYGWRGLPPHYYGGYWGSRSITIGAPPRGIHGVADPSFLDPAVARRGTDYSTLGEQRRSASGAVLNAADDWYAGADGDVYRRSGDGWDQHDGDGWSTMAELERQYGNSARRDVGTVGTPQQPQRQAYQQNPEDMARMERYYQSRQRSFNMYGTVSVRQ